MGELYAYIRVSTQEQHPDRQIEGIKKHFPTISDENLFIEKISGKKGMDECFELHAQIDIIKEVLISAVVQSTKPLDKRKAAYKELESLIDQNRKAFSDTQEAFKPGQHIGVYRKNVYGNHEVIIPTKYMMPLLHGIPINQILVDSGDERVRQPQNYELRNILTHWKQQGWLQYAGRGDQLYLKRKLDSVYTR